MISAEEYVAALRDELRQNIRMLEDAVTMDAHSSIYMTVGKIAKIQSTIDMWEQKQDEWSNENE